MANDHPQGGSQLAGLVLALLGVVTLGATSAFGLVLCVEWLCDPRRTPQLREWDFIGFVLAIPGVAFFVWLSVEHYGNRESGMIVAYWSSFVVWVLFRARTRWRELRETGNGPLPTQENHNDRGTAQR